ncbi:MAG TPA: 2-oxoglutarate dehydrogenase E1 component [Desulfobacteraceae bacterium]|nr:2-oxoglutarate dehydrogenase E1 component [Desulfobacteraceae bacterium]
MDVSGIWDLDYMEALYRQWKENPDAVGSDWQHFFKGVEFSSRGLPAKDGGTPVQAGVDALIHRYRDLGHLMACMDPLTACPTSHPLLALENFGLSETDLEKEFRGVNGELSVPLKEIIGQLRQTYCRSLGVEYMHLQDPVEKKWLRERMEPSTNLASLTGPEKRRILKKLVETTAFEKFLHKRYPGQTRFSLEGAEVVVPMMDRLFSLAAGAGCREIVLGMAHRGRLSILTQVLQKPYAEVFSEFEACYDPEHSTGAGDVKYHNGYLADLNIGGNTPLKVLLMSNPSHLESVNPVVEGIARARQDGLDADGRSQVLPMLIHGDAAFAGQGVVAETLNMSRLEGYQTGGTIHVVINNQIGYTTAPEHARSTRYSTDIAKMLMVPVFHVHGEDPEAVMQAVNLAVDYRWAFQKDVVIDVVCYRRYGHNEGDEPYFTQPAMYDRIRQRPSLYKVYRDQLATDDPEAAQAAEAIRSACEEELSAVHDRIRGQECAFNENRFYEEWDTVSPAYSPAPVATGVPERELKARAHALYTPPSQFTLHRKLERVFDTRLQTVSEGSGIDWATAEALAFASLAAQGVPIRLSGQDSGRGTFSQRHSVLRDMKTGKRHVPLNAIAGDQAPYRVYDSFLSEAGVLGFEYGYALARPRHLVLWEAQFGDFINNAQAVVDLYIASGESKWQRQNGLVLLLPHGYEGMGPEHSSARVERFLQLCAGNNLQVCNPTTPAQYFHLLRRQALQPFRKPLIVLTPKSLLRHPKAVSNLSEMTSGTYRTVIEDTGARTGINRVLFCAGKIYYDLMEHMDTLGITDTAVIRIEQYYPFPDRELEKAIAPFKTAAEWFWVQEEPANMGAWEFIRPNIQQMLSAPLVYAGRPRAASPATGYSKLHKQEQAAILTQALSTGHGLERKTG